MQHGMPTLQVDKDVKRKQEIMRQKRKNCMNCRTQKLKNPELLDSPQVSLEEYKKTMNKRPMLFSFPREVHKN